MVERNKHRIDPLLPSVVAVIIQFIATAYLYSINSSTGSIVASAMLTIIYAIVTYLLNREPNKKK